MYDQFLKGTNLYISATLITLQFCHSLFKLNLGSETSILNLHFYSVLLFSRRSHLKKKNSKCPLSLLKFRKISHFLKIHISGYTAGEKKETSHSMCKFLTSLYDYRCHSRVVMKKLCQTQIGPSV